MIITEEKLQQAIDGMTETDETAAEEKVQVERMEYLCKLRRSKAFLNSDGNIEQRKATAELSQEVQQAQEDYFTALGKYETTKARRETNALIVEVWRSENANRRQGNI